MQWELFSFAEIVAYEFEYRFVSKLPICCATSADSANALRVKPYGHFIAESYSVHSNTRLLGFFGNFDVIKKNVRLAKHEFLGRDDVRRVAARLRGISLNAFLRDCTGLFCTDVLLLFVLSWNDVHVAYMNWPSELTADTTSSAYPPAQTVGSWPKKGGASEQANAGLHPYSCRRR